MLLFDLTLPTVAANLAFDEAILIEADAGRGSSLLRLWDPPEIAVVLGASRRLADDVSTQACASDQVPILRRSSGGGTVLVGPGVFCVTVVLPDDAAPGLARVDLAHTYVLDRIATALRQPEPAVTVFGHGDLVIHGRKFAGSAQRRLRNWFMVHCSILFNFPIEQINRCLKMPSRQPEYRAGRSHDDFLCNVPLTREALASTIRDAFSANKALLQKPLVPPDLLESLLSEKFANRQWIERF